MADITTKQYPLACPYCGHKNDMLSSVGREMPEPGDFLTCSHCSEFGVFTSPNEARKATPAEIIDLYMNGELKQVKEVVTHLMKEGKLKDEET